MKIERSSTFKKDFKRIQKRGLNMELLKAVIIRLAIPESLPEVNRPHPLTGDYKGYLECHIAPDWLLIYRYTSDSLELVRTGTHSDLFKK